MTDWKEPPDVDESVQLIVPNGSTGYCTRSITKVPVVCVWQIIPCRRRQCQYLHLIHWAKMLPKLVGSHHNPAKIVGS